MIILQSSRTLDEDRTEAFRAFVERRAGGEVFVPPLLLNEEQRRLYLRRTLREDHRFRIANHPEGAQAKFDRLTESPFAFFRGTALLYYRDYAGDDLHLPIVFTVGDMHPENFGVMPNEDGAPFFGVNDFDEAYFAPFSYDVKRGAVGFWLTARANGLKKKKAARVVRDWVEGYLEGLREFALNDREKWHEYRLDNSPAMIKALLEDAMEDREGWLADYVDLDKERFVPSDAIVLHAKHVDAFQKAIDTYVKKNEIDTKDEPKDFFTVKDVAIKKASGTASLGLDRYWVLINGKTDAPEDNLILEMKQARRSALYGLIPDALMPDFDGSDEVEPIVTAHAVHLAGGDPFYGRVEMDGKAFIVRERSPFKNEIDLDDLDEDELDEYARLCGKVLAQAHARSDEDTGVMEGSAETMILSAIDPAVFTDDVVRFARAAARRIEADWQLFQEDLALGAFEFLRPPA